MKCCTFFVGRIGCSNYVRAKIAKMPFALHLWRKSCAGFFAQVLEGEAVDRGETNLSLTSLGDQYHLKSIKVFINQPEILLICVMMEN